MKHYNVKEALELLKKYKITTNGESIRRWLRSGIIKGIPPVSRKEGWLIREDDLYAFIRSRLPDDVISIPGNTTNDVSKSDRESIRSEMWWELAGKSIFEESIEPKRKQVQECIQHRGHSKDFEKHVWDTISKHKRGYATPRIPYLLDAFLFDGKRIRMDDNFELLDEKILYALIEEIRKQRTGESLS